MCLRVSYKKKIFKKYFFASLKSLKKGVGPRIRIRTKMIRIPNTGDIVLHIYFLLYGRGEVGRILAEFLEGGQVTLLREPTSSPLPPPPPAAWNIAELSPIKIDLSESRLFCSFL